MRDADALLAANPDEISISVSGFHQDTYGVTHAGGDIEVVKKHMRTLADAKKRLASKTTSRSCFTNTGRTSTTFR